MPKYCYKDNEKDLKELLWQYRPNLDGFCVETLDRLTCTSAVSVCHTLVNMNDDALHKFWELEEPPNPTHGQLSQKERLAIRHFKDHHSRTAEGRFIVPLLKESSNLIIGES